MSKYFGSISIPTKFRPIFTAATPVLPEPINGSATTPPMSVLAATIFSIKRTGFGVGWSLATSLGTRHKLESLLPLSKCLPLWAKINISTCAP